MRAPYEVDWVGAIAAGVAAVIAFLLSKGMFPRVRPQTTYIVAGLLTVLFSLAFRVLLRHLGI